MTRTKELNFFKLGFIILWQTDIKCSSRDESEGNNVIRAILWSILRQNLTDFPISSQNRV